MINWQQLAPWKLWTLTLIAALACWFAGIGMAEANTLTDATLSSSFACIGNVSSGSLLTLVPCVDDPLNGKIFSYFICRFEHLLNDVMADMYCAVAFEARPAIRAALTLLVVIYGAAFLMGVTPLNAKESLILAAKLTLVVAFATNSQTMIGIGYNLFISIIKEGITIVISNVFESGSYTSGGSVYELFDNALNNVMSLASEGENKPLSVGGTPLAATYEPIGKSCDNALFAALIILAMAFPPLAMVGIYFIMKLLWILLRAVFGYCQGLLGVSFLIIFAPIFVSFLLFKPTRSLFDKWIQYLFSFSFQMIIVFAFLALIFNIMSRMTDDFQDFMDLIVPIESEVGPGAAQVFRLTGCSVCELNPSEPRVKPSCKSNQPMQYTELVQHESFMRFVMVKIFALVIMFYVLDMMMSLVPQMAVLLAGPKYAGQLGGGSQGIGGGTDTLMSMPGEGIVSRGIGGQPVTGFDATLNKLYGSLYTARNTPQGIATGFAEAGSYMLTGDGGLVDQMIRSVANPNDPMRLTTDQSVQRDKDGNVILGGAEAAFEAGVALTGAAGLLSRAGAGGQIDAGNDQILSIRRAIDSASFEGATENDIRRAVENAVASLPPDQARAAIQQVIERGGISENATKALCNIIGQ